MNERYIHNGSIYNYSYYAIAFNYTSVYFVWENQQGKDDIIIVCCFYNRMPKNKKKKPLIAEVIP